MASYSSSSENIICCSIFLGCILVQLVRLTTIKLPPNVRVPALLVFGDSIVDPGNNNHLVSVVKANYPPYGRDFMGGTPSGRFSNGLIPSDLIEHWGLDLLPAYLDPSLGPNDLLTGVSFASGEYLAKIQAVGGEERTKSIIPESVYLIVAGSHDLANTYFTSRLRSNYDVPAYTDLMVQGAIDILQELYDMGARRFAVFSAPPIGCVPSQRTLGGGKERNCAESYNQAAQMFN
ncbi:hypothetical protein MKX01_006283 [Papaver californicum]|nr:hypothetical protein MKX01_006283 [Papaver californicum]